MIGWLGHHDVLRAYTSHLAQQVQDAGQVRPAPAASEPAPQAMASRPTAPPQVGEPGAGEGDAVLSRLHGYRVVDLEVGQTAALVGQQIREVAWPPGALVVAVRRARLTFAPNGRTDLRAGDRVSILVRREDAETLVERLRTGGPHGCRPRPAT
jgi:hypothetical protein